MRRIVLTLTDEEYANLEQRAQADRRSVRDMAARLVTQPDLIRADWTWRPQPWVNPYTATSGTLTAPPCYACQNPAGRTAEHTCVRINNGTSVLAARID